MSKSSIQLHNELRDLDAKIAEARAKFNATEGDEQALCRDAINQYKGQQDALNEQLHDVLEAEDAMRRDGGVPLAAPVDANVFKPRNLAQQFLGDPGAFTGLTAADVNVKKAVHNEYQEFGLGTVERVDLNIPRQTNDNAPYFGIIDTLGTASTDADLLTYFIPDTDAYKNNAAKWKKGQTKAKSEMAWKKETAYLETVAHYVPVSKLEMRDYGQLENVINTELLYGLRRNLAAAVVSQAADASDPGIVGLTKNANVQKYTKLADDTIADSAYRMANDVFLKSGYAATHIAMHPYVSESVELSKDTTGRYLNVMVGGKLFALTVVDDANLVDTTKYGMMVYWNGGATVFTKHQDEVSIGLVDSQFIQNEYTILAEGTHGLKVARPDAFSYLADTGVTGR